MHSFIGLVRHVQYICILYTVNDKSFEGEKFRGLLGSSGMQGKVSRFFPSLPSYMSELSEEQKFSRENFRGLIKIRENREGFLTMKLLSFTVLKTSVKTMEVCYTSFMARIKLSCGSIKLSILATFSNLKLPQLATYSVTFEQPQMVLNSIQSWQKHTFFYNR